jgi:exonuclease III
MLHLKTTCYKLTIPNLKIYQENSIVIQSFNVHSLNLHFREILAYQNLLASHILCLNETKIQNICTYQEIHNAKLNNKFNIFSCYN